MINRIRRFIGWRIIGVPEIRIHTTDNVDIEEAKKPLFEWPEDFPKPFVGLTQDTNENPHWTKSRRFLKNNRF